VAALNSQIASYQSQLSSLQNQVSSLQAIVGLSISTQIVRSQSFSTGSTGLVQVASFNASYAGYITVAVSSPTDYLNMGIQTYNAFASNIVSPNYDSLYLPLPDYYFTFSSSSDTLILPVLPGGVTVFLITSDSSSQNATLSVTYYY
jgi:hypothetical protein